MILNAISFSPGERLRDKRFPVIHHPSHANSSCLLSSHISSFFLPIFLTTTLKGYQMASRCQTWSYKGLSCNPEFLADVDLALTIYSLMCFCNIAK